MAELKGYNNMKNLINRLFIFTICMVAFSQSSIAYEYPELRVTSIDVSDYKNQYSKALNNDPYEKFNRSMYAFNETVDNMFLEPVSRFYRDSLPLWGRERVSDFFTNLGEIGNFVNGIFQGDVEATFRAFTRFGINSTWGIGGLHDVAGGFGLREKEKTFSQTLAVYGFKSGSYLVVPFVGPSTGRDFAGDIFNRASDPATYLSSSYLAVAFGLVELVDIRADLLDLTDEIEMTSFDPYSAYKSSYLQHQRKRLLKTLK